MNKQFEERLAEIKAKALDSDGSTSQESLSKIEQVALETHEKLLQLDCGGSLLIVDTGESCFIHGILGGAHTEQAIATLIGQMPERNRQELIKGLMVQYSLMPNLLNLLTKRGN